MGFLSFSLEYYSNELQKLESAAANRETIYHAKQLLKMLDDLLDEGYTALNEVLEEQHQGVSRLKNYLRENGATPFPIYQKAAKETDQIYGGEECELNRAIHDLVLCGQDSRAESADPFLAELIRFCEWIGYEKDTAYIFLLRDTLLPYLFYRQQGRATIYPWLLGRKAMAALTGKPFADDEIRAAIIRALETGKSGNFDDFCHSVLSDLRSVLRQFPEAEACLTAMLRAIPEKRILVVESGCSGTFPMLLKCLDARVDVRMYTTYPYLLRAYGARIYSSRYEDNRLFETLYSQDLYFQFSSLRSHRFYVKTCSDRDVRAKAHAEVKTILKESARLL